MGSAHAKQSLFLGVWPCIPLIAADSKEGDAYWHQLSLQEAKFLCHSEGGMFNSRVKTQVVKAVAVGAQGVQAPPWVL